MVYNNTFWFFFYPLVYANVNKMLVLYCFKETVLFDTHITFSSTSLSKECLKYTRDTIDKVCCTSHDICVWNWKRANCSYRTISCSCLMNVWFKWWTLYRLFFTLQLDVYTRSVLHKSINQPLITCARNLNNHN